MILDGRIRYNKYFTLKGQYVDFQYSAFPLPPSLNSMPPSKQANIHTLHESFGNRTVACTPSDVFSMVQTALCRSRIIFTR